MKKLSRWAKNNPKLARIIIACSHVLLIINAICFGVLLYLFDCGELNWLVIIIANLFFVLYIFYPKKGKGKNKLRYSYVKQKAFDFSLVLSYSLVITLGVNNFLAQPTNGHQALQQPTARFMVYEINSESPTANHKKIKSEIKKKIKKARKQIKQGLRDLKKELKRKDDETGMIALRILIALLMGGIAFILGAVVAGLACNLSCSGQEGLAAVVLVVGWGAIVWLGIIALKAIFDRMENNRNKKKSKKDSNVTEEG